jgi:hypothetical protein
VPGYCGAQDTFYVAPSRRGWYLSTDFHRYVQQGQPGEALHREDADPLYLGVEGIVGGVNGKTPMQTFLDSLALARDKQIDNPARQMVS